MTEELPLYLKLIGYGLAVTGSIAFVPQILKVWKSKSGEGLNLTMFIILDFVTSLISTFCIKSGELQSLNIIIKKKKKKKKNYVCILHHVVSLYSSLCEPPGVHQVFTKFAKCALRVYRCFTKLPNFGLNFDKV